jgi:hypothetical protein
MGAARDLLAGYPGKQGMTLADEVVHTFDELVANKAEVLTRFQEAFNERAKLPELPEADGGADGLSRVLSGLLRQTPSDAYLKPESYEGAFNDASFATDFKTALMRVANLYPQTLILLKKHQQQKQCRLSDLLCALLVDYTANSAAYPY